MKLNKEQILTLSLIKGFGIKKILSIGFFASNTDAAITTIDDLYDVIHSIKGKAFSKLTKEDIIDANEKANKLIAESERKSIGLIGYFDEEFPESFRNTINENGKLMPPVLLWFRGDISILKTPGIAVIGTREPTVEGIIGGKYLAAEFAKRGMNIISGLALGCDTCAHEGSLAVKGRTTAILGNGLDYDSVYPSENKDLAERIVANGGLLLSEYTLDEHVSKYSLVARDRLQCALANATLVIQTGTKGGTMHAAASTLVSKKPLYVMHFKNNAVNNNDKCLGNALLVDKGAKYIHGNDNIDEIYRQIKRPVLEQKDLFDKV